MSFVLWNTVPLPTFKLDVTFAVIVLGVKSIPTLPLLSMRMASDQVIAASAVPEAAFLNTNSPPDAFIYNCVAVVAEPYFQPDGAFVE